VYILESASNKVLKESDNESTIVFCIDNSGSMNTTQEVKGKINLKHGISAA
jgi:Mg-chelatase subunit ChlD